MQGLVQGVIVIASCPRERLWFLYIFLSFLPSFLLAGWMGGTRAFILYTPVQ